jgi:hypothetical protein
MQLNIKVLFCLLSPVLLSACNKANDESFTTFTLHSGISIEEAAKCNIDSAKEAIEVESSSPSNYLVTVTTHLPCDSEFEQPWLTLEKDGHATLVLNTKERRIGFDSRCDCSRTIRARIDGRLRAGQTLYVVSDHEVLGHKILSISKTEAGLETNRGQPPNGR